MAELGGVNRNLEELGGSAESLVKLCGAYGATASFHFAFPLVSIILSPLSSSKNQSRSAGVIHLGQWKLKRALCIEKPRLLTLYINMQSWRRQFFLLTNIIFLDRQAIWKVILPLPINYLYFSEPSPRIFCYVFVFFTGWCYETSNIYKEEVKFVINVIIKSPI